MAMHERPLLSLMRDIHTPDGVDWWPLAPGGWLLLLLGSTLLVFSLLRQYRGNRLQHEARSELIARDLLFAVLARRCDFHRALGQQASRAQQHGDCGGAQM